MTEPDIIREQLVNISTMRCLTLGLPDWGYVLSGDGQNVNVRSAFPTPTERETELTMTTLAFGFNIDDGGEAAEMGSTLTRYVHTLMCWVFATSPEFGERLAHVLAHIVRRSGNSGDAIPIYDFNQPPGENGLPPQIDTDIVMRAQVSHQVNNSVRPWDRYVWTCGISVQDIAYP